MTPPAPRRLLLPLAPTTWPTQDRVFGEPGQASGSLLRANELPAPVFGLPALPWVVFDDEADQRKTWKLASVKRFVGARPMAWVDDDIGHDAQRWAREPGARTLLVKIRARRRLAAKDVERLLGFCGGSQRRPVMTAGLP